MRVPELLKRSNNGEAAQAPTCKNHSVDGKMQLYFHSFFCVNFFQHTPQYFSEQVEMALEYEPLDSSCIYDYPHDAVAAEGTRPATDAAKGANPYMLRIDDMPETFLLPFVPMWRTLQMPSASGLEKLLKRWQSEIKPWHENKMPATHVSMSKASFHVPDDKEADFLRHYALGVTLGAKFFLVEQLTPVFRLFVDLDIAQLAGVKEHHMEGAAFIVQRTVSQFYPDVADDDTTTLRAIVCTTTYKRKPPKGDIPELWKSGIHIHFPNLFVTRTEALHIRESCVVELEGSGEGFGKRVPPSNSWREAYDETVYGKGTKGGGLRMVGSRKTDPCPQCDGKYRKKGDTSPVCIGCNGEAKVDSGRPYFPLLVLGGQPRGARRSLRDLDAEKAYHDNFELLIRDTKVRTTLASIPDEPRFSIPDAAPLYIETALRKKAGGGGRGGANGQLTVVPRGNVANTEPAWDALQLLVRESFGARYARVVLQSVTSNAARSYFTVHVSGENSRYCQNIRREHARNRIYFHVTADGIAQKCHDVATEQSAEMRFGLCGSYSAGPEPIPQRLAPLLFTKKNQAPTPSAFVVHDGGDSRTYRDRKLVRNVAYLDFLAGELGYATWSSTISLQDGHRIVRTRREGEPSFMSVDPSAMGTTSSRTLRALGLEEEGNLQDESDADVSEDRQRTWGVASPRAAATRLSLKDLETDLFKVMEMWVDAAATSRVGALQLWREARTTDEPRTDEADFPDLSHLYESL